MSVPVNKNVGSRGTTMAIACVTSITAALGSMYLMGRDTKSKEGVSSPYETGGKGPRGTDKAMTSSDVSAAVSVPRPGNTERLSGAVPSKNIPA